MKIVSMNSVVIRCLSIVTVLAVVGLAHTRSASAQVSHSAGISTATTKLGVSASFGSPVPVLNSRILRSAESLDGQTVGEGHCWAYVNEVFNLVGAKRTGSYVWGEEVYVQIVEDGKKTESPTGPNQILPGDVLQIFKARFDYPNGGWSSAPEQHTAIVTAVGENGYKLTVSHQNWGKRSVLTSEFDLRYLTFGKAYVYRPTR